jgi:hypothetical protein
MTEKRIFTTEEIIRNGCANFPSLGREEYYQLRWQLAESEPCKHPVFVRDGHQIQCASCGLQFDVSVVTQ